MMHTENQQTFLSYGELFSRSAQRCLKAERSIRSHIDKVEAPYSTAMALVADAEHRLATDLASYAENGPDNLVCTRIQFALDETAPPEPENLTEALQNVTRVNEQLAEVLVDQTDKATLVYLVTHIVTFRASQFARSKWCGTPTQFAGNVGYLSKNCNAAAGELGGSLRASRQRPTAALRFLDVAPLCLRKRVGMPHHLL